MTTTLGLHLPLDSETVINGAVKVRCVAVLSPVLWTSNKEKVLPRQDNREALLLGKYYNIMTSLNIIYLHIFRPKVIP